MVWFIFFVVFISCWTNHVNAQRESKCIESSKDVFKLIPNEQETLTFEESAAFCRDIDADILFIQNFEEFEVINSVIQNELRIVDYSKGLWLGLFDKDEGFEATDPLRFDYISPNGDEFSREFFQTGQEFPWNFQHPNGKENKCVTMNSNRLDISKVEWFDASCTENKGLICRKQCDTESPTKETTLLPTKQPTRNPTKSPTKQPSRSPTKLPTKQPSRSPTKSPFKQPSRSPTNSQQPSRSPTKSPTKQPSRSPTKSPSQRPTLSPNTGRSENPSRTPTNSPSKFLESESPTELSSPLNEEEDSFSFLIIFIAVFVLMSIALVLSIMKHQKKVKFLKKLTIKSSITRI